MTRIARLKLAAAFIAAFFLAPIHAYSMTYDEYARNSVNASLGLEYERRDYDRAGTKTNSSQFRQIYSLNLSGKILSSRLITYDAGTSLTKNAGAQSSGDKQDTKVTNYSLNTGLLPRSRIPIKLYGNKNISNHTSKSASRVTRSESVNTNYGINWLGKFETLPMTTFNFKRSKNEIGDRTSVQDYYYATLQKDIGPSANFASFTRGESSSNTAGGAESTSAGITASNITQLSRTTRINASGNQHSSQYSAGTNSDSKGVGLHFDSKPNDEFAQKHAYSFAKSKSGATSTEGNFYSGSMSYDIRRKLRSNLSITDNKTVFLLNQSKLTAHSSRNAAYLSFASGKLLTSEGIEYSGTKTTTSGSAAPQLNTTSFYSSKTSTTLFSYSLGLLSISQSFVYAATDTNTPNTATPRSNTTSFSSTTSAGYNRFFDFGSAGLSAGLGYTEAKANDKTGLKGFTETLNASTSAYKLDYTTLSANASYTQVENTAGDRSKNRALNFNASGGNKLWAEYMTLGASYSKNYTRSWLVEKYSTDEVYTLTAGTTYFTGTTLNMSLNHSKYDNKIVGPSTTDTKIFSIERPFVFFDSPLNSSINKSVSTVNVSGWKQSISTTYYMLDYTKTLLRSVYWIARASRTETKTNDSTFSNISSLTTSLSYMLRSWSIGAEYSYTSNESSRYKNNESRYFARLSRGFGFSY